MSRSAAHEVPKVFTQFRSLFKIHLRRIMEIPKKQPIFAVALLVVIACEALSRLLGRQRDDDVFAKDYLARHGIPIEVGRDLFDALRNGLAHVYEPYPILVRGKLVQPTLAWKGAASLHLKIGTTVIDSDGHQLFRPFRADAQHLALCLDVESMVEDLNELLSEIHDQLRDDANLSAELVRNARKIRARGTKHRQGASAKGWHDFITRQAHQSATALD